MPSQPAQLRIGLVTDIHYADKDPAINRYYRESIEKLAEAIDTFNREKADLVIDLGDTIDSDTAERDAHNLRTINAIFRRAKADRHIVLGNHSVERLSKRAFLDLCQQEKSFCSFDKAGFHFVILDACYRHDGVSYDEGHFDWQNSNIPPHECDWLAADLKATDLKALVFVHQRLDAPPSDPHAIRSAPTVREILEKSGKVLAVFQGHYHRGGHTLINGIPYWTLPAMVEGSGPAKSGYTLLTLDGDGLSLKGFRRHADFFTTTAPAPFQGEQG